MNLLFLAQQSPGPRAAWAPVVLMILIGVIFAVVSLALSRWIGPRQTNPAKEGTYESGMIPVGTAQRRFNVRFYVVAMIFLVFDVEVVFFYPWATIFTDYATQPALPFGGVSLSTFLLIEMLIFVGILLLAYIYAWGKGAFRWD